MTTVNLRGYDVDFPYLEPYDIQKTYMERVLTCLDKKTHAVLESPTGTGKTLCLFAPVTAWSREKKKAVSYTTSEYDREFVSPHFDSTDQLGKWGSKRRSKVWYTARTHSQIAQTVSEVRKCNIEGLHVRVMGARDQLCINKLVLDEKESFVKTVKCKELVKAKHCKYYNKLNYEKDTQKFYQTGKVLDIEDLVSVGKSCGVCPYFLSKKASETADIVLLPYNYILEKESRDSIGIYLQDDVIIFDEGHNIPSTCEESFEFSFSSLDIAIALRNVKEVMVNLTTLTDSLTEDQDLDVATHATNSMLIMEILQRMETGLDDLPMSNELLPVTSLYQFFENAGVGEKTSRELLNAIENFKNDSSALTLSGSTLESFSLLEKMMNVLFGSVVRSFDEATIERSFKCGITIDPDHHTSVKKLSLYCFNPSFGIRYLLQQGVQSIIITSGTLSPLRTFITELGLPNPVTLENGHIAKKCQVPFVILGTGVNNVRMDGAYKNRNDSKYMSSLGITLTNLILSIPDGVLILFSSYTMMQKLKESWESDLGIWARMNALKRVFVEPRSKDEFINCMENYKRAIDSGNGAILMGVLRGKISEGMDFKNQYCRGVFIVGVPFPPVQDPRVRGKEKYAESLKFFNPETKAEEKLYSNSYMSIEAMKATNQAIGRVIRHGQDYGVIVLVDYRFAWPRLFSNISTWLRGDVPVENNFPMTKKLVRDFFRDIHSGKLGVEEIRCQCVDSNGCPVASYVSYEEYDHKKHAGQTVAWIGGSLVEEKTEKSQKKTFQRHKAKGCSTIHYIDEDTSESLLSMYKNSSQESQTSVSDQSTASGSLLDVLSNSKNTNAGYWEFDNANFFGKQQSENGKRKHNEEDNSSVKSPRLKYSPSMLSFPVPESSQSQTPKQKKYPRIKVRPLIPASAEEPENVMPNAPSNSTNSHQIKKEDEEELKVKLIDYYRSVRQSLSKEDDQKFKTCSCKYMKGEATLNEVINLMDECFLTPGNTNLFAGFGICIKGKDKEQWISACRTRNINVT